ncbi:hypothetical protein [Dorea longicatena]|uniref:hypothetical protein n=1 Tax=Dorea longicatena TaxID=88431 RepID=UPI001111448C|nr:hypothetical protein [Dorea longicatena]
MLDHLEKKEYQKAMDIAESIDWRRVKNASMLNTVSEIYEYNGEFKKGRDILFLAFDRAPGSRKIVYRLGTLALKIKDIREATDCYEEFVKLAPKDPNQYILKYKILRTQGAALSDQIAALEEFKKAEYIEKWAYELAKLYDEAGMTAECLEECDDLILWFSEGKYVYLAMELKMKYKPLTPLQQEKYDSRPGAVKKQPQPVKQTESTLEEVDDENEYDEGSEEEVQESTVQRIDDAQVQEIPPEPVPMQEEFEIPEEAAQADVVPEEVVPEATAAVEETPMYREEEPEASVETPEEHASAIKQVVTGATLEEALAQGVAVASGINIEEEAMKEREDEILANGQMMIDDILQKWEAKQKDHEEAIAKQKAKDEERLQKEREQARIRQEEERKEVERKAAEAEARRKAEEEARRKAEEEAARKAERNTQRIPDDIVRLMEEMESENEDSEDEIYEEELEDGPGMDEDFIEGIEDELAGLDMNGSSFEEGDFDEADFEEEDLEGEDFDEGDFEEEDLEGEDFDEGDFEEEDFDEEDFDEADFEEEDLDEEELEEADFDEDDDEDDFEDIDDEETDFDEGDFEEDMDEEDFDEEEIDDDEELDFGEDLEGEDFDEADFEEEDLDEGDFEEEDFDEEEIEDEDDTEELEIEEPSEEEIQARIKKSKGGVPFDTGFVVTGRYDLSATSEIGLKAGLTEEQKKLFSYFVPVRGMSEQIVEVLDNDRRAQREGTSKTGNLLVIGRKGSGKTVLAVDIVKAIQKQRNLKQGKVAIVTGESLNKKELTNIIQKLRGGAIIIEHAGKLNSRTVKELNYLMEKKTGELLFVLEDQRKPLERLMTANPEFKKKFSSKLELPVFINDELVTFGQTYAKENGYKLDEMGILALYSRIDVMQREDHAVSVAEVKEIMDEAIAHSQKANVKHLARRVFGKGTDDSDRIILKEEDFKI